MSLKKNSKLQHNIIEFIKIIKSFGSYSLRFSYKKKNFLFDTAKAFADRNENVISKGNYKINKEIPKIKRSLELRFKSLNFP